MTAPTIAILDEDPSFLCAMHDLLAAAGYQTLRHCPNDVVDVHALIERSQPALVILDRWWRRGNDGWEFLKHLWADPRTTHIGVVLTSGGAVAPSLQAEILRTMRCQVVQTPLDRHEVLGAIETLLGAASVRRGPGRRVAALAAPVPMATAREPERLLEEASHPLAAERASAELPGHVVAARAARPGSSALDAASDS